MKLAVPTLRAGKGDQDQDRDDDDDADDALDTYDVHLGYGAGLTWKGAYVLGASPEKVAWAARKVVGQGMVLGLASDDLLTNAGLAHPPNAAALIALLAPWASREIHVARIEDGVAPPSNPVTALIRAGLGLGLAHAVVAGLLMVLAFGIRQARARPTPPPARRAWTEHLEATGGLYERARLAPHALAAYARFVDARVRARMPRGMTDPAAFLALRAKADPTRCAALWTRATAARSDDVARGDELAALRELSALYAAATKAE